jgi:hypothetical protein
MAESNTPIMFLESLNAKRVEEAYRQASIAQERRWQNFADTGYRAAKARDPRLMKALEAMAEVTGKIQEDQFGRTMRSPDTPYSIQQGTTEHGLCREAYRMADEGTPLRNFEWIYGAAAWLCGYIC